jgi:drug/metabolite transporter (DMT)-like permease
MRTTIPTTNRTTALKKRLTWLDWGFIAALVLVALLFGAADNILQEIEATVMACLVALIYIGLQMRR